MIKIMKNFKKNEWILLGISVVFIVMQVWLDLKLPEYMSAITTLVQTKGSKMEEILFAGGYMVLCAVGSLILSVSVGYFAAKIAAALSTRLRSIMFDKVQAFSMEEINQFSTASLITRTTNDIRQVQITIAMGLQLMIKAPLTATFAIMKIAGKAWQWTSVVGIAVFLLLLVIIVISVFALPKFREIQNLVDNLNSITRENLTGLSVIRAYNAEDYQENKFDEANTNLTNTSLFAGRLMSILQPMMGFVRSSISLGIYWVGAYLIFNANSVDKLPLFSDMVVFSSYAMQIIMSFMMLAMIFIMLPRASVSAKRINEVLETEPKIKDGDDANLNTSLEGEIEVRNVYFKYPDAEEYILEDINFTVKQGETVAFIGSTGSGKSTLINLIPRFYDTTEGEILINGTSVRDYKLETLYNILGYVSQKAVLFSGTVSSNVALGKNGIEKKNPEESIKRAIELAQGKEFVEQMENQYAGKIAQGGTNVSGGQKQRLSIARAIYREPQIYIFDDSFSALDYKTDKILRTILNKETVGKTKLIVAQRIGTIIDADKIIVLDKGKIVGIGKHKELLKTCNVYGEIAKSQFSEEELSNE